MEKFQTDNRCNLCKLYKAVYRQNEYVQLCPICLEKTFDHMYENWREYLKGNPEYASCHTPWVYNSNKVIK